MNGRLLNAKNIRHFDDKQQAAYEKTRSALDDVMKRYLAESGDSYEKFAVMFAAVQFALDVQEPSEETAKKWITTPAD